MITKRRSLLGSATSLLLASVANAGVDEPRPATSEGEGANPSGYHPNVIRTLSPEAV